MLYHHQVFMPKNLLMPTAPFLLNYSTHAKIAANNDRYGLIKLPASIDPKYAKVIEVETDDNDNVIKIVYRTPYNNQKALCIVVVPAERLVKTVWLNERLDKHQTLNTSKYSRE